MIPIELPTGKTVFVSSEEYINALLKGIDIISDYVAKDAGIPMNDPFFGSSLRKSRDRDLDNDILLLEAPDLSDLEDIELEEDI